MNNSLPIKEIFSSIQGEGECAGRRQIFIRLTGCNLKCAYCDTDFTNSDVCQIETEPGSGFFSSDKKELSAKTLIHIIKDWCNKLPGGHHSISITGGEPLLHADILLPILPKINNILPIYLETNGTLPQQLLKIVHSIYGISMDIKLPSTTLYQKELWEIHRGFLKIASISNVSVKLVVAESTTKDEIQMACTMVKNVHKIIPLFIQPLTKVDGSLGISVQHLLHLQETASNILSNVRVIPQMHLMMGAL